MDFGLSYANIDESNAPACFTYMQWWVWKIEFLFFTMKFETNPRITTNMKYAHFLHFYKNRLDMHCNINNGMLKYWNGRIITIDFCVL